jgi:hypothetical protein
MAELARIVRRGGVSAACIFDANGLALVKTFSEAARRSDPAAPDDANLPFPRMPELVVLWQRAGLHEVQTGASMSRRPTPTSLTTRPRSGSESGRPASTSPRAPRPSGRGSGGPAFSCSGTRRPRFCCPRGQVRLGPGPRPGDGAAISAASALVSRRRPINCATTERRGRGSAGPMDRRGQQGWLAPRSCRGSPGPVAPGPPPWGRRR